MGGFNESTWLCAGSGFLLSALTVGAVAAVAAWIKWSWREAAAAGICTGLACLALLWGLRIVVVDPSDFGGLLLQISWCGSSVPAGLLGLWLSTRRRTIWAAFLVGLLATAAVAAVIVTPLSFAFLWTLPPGEVGGAISWGLLGTLVVFPWVCALEALSIGAIGGGIVAWRNRFVHRWQFTLPGLVLTTTLVALLLGAGLMIYYENVSPPFAVDKLAISLDGDLVAACPSGQIHVWQRGADGGFLEIAGWRVPRYFAPRLTEFLVVRDNHLMCVDRDGDIERRDLRSGQAVERFTPPAMPRSPGVLSPDGKWLAFRSADGKTIRLWNVLEKKQVATVKPPNEISSVYGLSLDGKTLAAFRGGPSAALQLWDMRRSTLLHEFPVAYPEAVMLSLDGSTLALVQPRGTRTTISTWNVRSGKRQAVIHNDNWVVATALSPDGTKMATADRQGAIKLWNAQTGSLQASRPQPPGQRVGLRFFPDGRSILVGYSCEDLPLWRHAKISVRNTETLEEEVVLWRKDLRWQTATMALAFAGWLAWLVGRHRRRRRGSIAQADQRFGQDQPKKQYSL